MTKLFNLLETSSIDERQGSSWDDGITLWKTGQVLEGFKMLRTKVFFLKNILRLSTGAAIKSCSNSPVLEKNIGHLSH